MRWLFLSNLIRDIAEIQTLPFQPYQPPPPSPTISTTATTSSQQNNHHHHHYTTTTAATAASAYTEEQWRDQCIRGILSYPPGMQRALVMDGLRTELAQQLCHELYRSHDIVKKHVAITMMRRRKKKNQSRIRTTTTTTTTTSSSSHPDYEDATAVPSSGEDISSIISDDDDVDDDGSDSDPFLDADVEIVRAFEEATGVSAAESGSGSNQKTQKVATLAISKNETTVIDNESSSSSSSSSNNKNDHTSTTTPSASSSDNNNNNDNIPSPQQVQQAYKTMRDARDYLPQLVSAVLKSPPALDPNLSNPVQRLRQVMLRQCLQDPSWGIELCWLLEAEVGRAWKTLFEHRQQTGRRLIVVLPAEKAAVLAKIGTEKRETFDLLQDAEQATAYGSTSVGEEEEDHQQQQQQEVLTSMIQQQREAMASSSGHPQHQQTQYHHHHYPHHKPSRLPSSLSLRRCSHFGDTMHFIDRLTKVSMDLRSVPVGQRESYLQENLYEMNRRIRRRMVTKGDVSLDVEDNRSPRDWPQLTDLTMEHLKYSVHLPLVPQTGVWPNGKDGASIRKQQHVDPPSPEVVRVLNIVVPESRLLASRERCPFLVHLEVADTGLEGHDARLYASGASGLGSTVEEALSMNNLAAAASATWQRRESPSPAYQPPPPPPQHVPYEIPSELIQERNVIHHASRVPPSVVMETNVGGMKKEFPRGGWQSDDQYYQDADGSYVHTDPYDAVRQQEYEQLHQQMQLQQSAQQPPTSHRMHWSLPRYVLFVVSKGACISFLLEQKTLTILSILL